MIRDAENIFFDSQDLSKGTASAIIANGAGGDAYNPLWVLAKTEAALSGDATIALKTSDNEDMSGAVTLGTMTLPAAETSKALMKLPIGAKKYLQAEVTGATTGTLSMALLLEADIA